MVASVKRGAYALAAVAYMFFTCGYLDRLSMPGVPNALERNLAVVAILITLPLIKFSIPLVPLSIIAARSNPPWSKLVFWYIALMYIGMLGVLVVGRDPLVFDAPTGTQISWQGEAINSLVFLAIFAPINFIPTAFVWGISRAIVQRHRAL